MQQGRRLAPLGLIVRAGVIVGQGVRLVERRRGQPIGVASGRATLLAGDPEDNSKQPGLELGARLEFRQAPVNDQEDILHGIVHRRRRYPQAAQVPPNKVEMLSINFPDAALWRPQRHTPLWLQTNRQRL